MLRDQPFVWWPRSNNSFFDKIIPCMFFLSNVHTLLDVWIDSVNSECSCALILNKWGQKIVTKHLLCRQNLNKLKSYNLAPLMSNIVQYFFHLCDPVTIKITFHYNKPHTYYFSKCARVISFTHMWPYVNDLKCIVPRCFCMYAIVFHFALQKVHNT